MHWAKEEENILRTFYAETPLCKILEKLPNRSISSIHHKASRLGLKIKGYWTESELTFLRDNYGKKTAKQIATELGRPKTACYDQAWRKNLMEKNVRFILKELTLTDRQKGYLAGIIDGEGCVTLGKVKNKERFYPHISVANTNYAIIDYVHQLVPFLSLGIRQPNLKYRCLRKLYVLQTRDLRKSYVLLKTIYSFLVGKKKNAELLLKFITLRLEKGADKAGRHVPYGEEEQRVYSYLIQLNRNKRKKTLAYSIP